MQFYQNKTARSGYKTACSLIKHLKELVDMSSFYSEHPKKIRKSSEIKTKLHRKSLPKKHSINKPAVVSNTMLILAKSLKKTTKMLVEQ